MDRQAGPHYLIPSFQSHKDTIVGSLGLVEGYQLVGERFLAVEKKMATVVNDGLDLQIVFFTTALQGGESRWFHKKPKLLGTRHAGIVAAALLLLWHRRNILVPRVSGAGAGDVKPALA